jgi:hypothetical protein
LAQDVEGNFLKVQLKGRFTVDKDYIGKDLWMAFPDQGKLYLFPHDEIMEQFLADSNVKNTVSWQRGKYSIRGLSKKLLEMRQPYLLEI